MNVNIILEIFSNGISYKKRNLNILNFKSKIKSQFDLRDIRVEASYSGT